MAAVAVGVVCVGVEQTQSHAPTKSQIKSTRKNIDSPLLASFHVRFTASDRLVSATGERPLCRWTFVRQQICIHPVTQAGSACKNKHVMLSASGSAGSWIWWPNINRSTMMNNNNKMNVCDRTRMNGWDRRTTYRFINAFAFGELKVVFSSICLLPFSSFDFSSFIFRALTVFDKPLPPPTHGQRISMRINIQFGSWYWRWCWAWAYARCLVEIMSLRWIRYGCGGRYILCFQFLPLFNLV